MSHHLSSDPKYFGPGTWMTVHQWARYLDIAHNDAFVAFSENTINHLWCGICRGHAKEYLKNHPLKPSTKDSEWAFKWWWEFHNYVNTSKNKKTMSYTEAYNYYSKKAIKKRFQEREKHKILNKLNS